MEKKILEKIIWHLEVLSASVAALEAHAESQGLKGYKHLNYA